MFKKKIKIFYFKTYNNHLNNEDILEYKKLFNIYYVRETKIPKYILMLFFESPLRTCLKKKYTIDF